VRAVANAGPLIHLSWIGRLDLLPALFNEILVPQGVQDEVLRARPDTLGLVAVRTAFTADWLQVRPVADPIAVAALRTELDRGESEAIVLMREAGADLLLLDERRARAVARRQGLPLTGTIGILRMARDRELISAVIPPLEDLQRHGFRISAAVVEQIRREETAR
jgi:predicted nucleic acid-binding protein